MNTAQNAYPYPLLVRINEFERSLSTTKMIAYMHTHPKQRIMIEKIVDILDISRRYLVLGYTARAVRAYLRATAIYSHLPNPQ